MKNNLNAILVTKHFSGLAASIHIKEFTQGKSHMDVKSAKNILILAKVLKDTMLHIQMRENLIVKLVEKPTAHLIH